MEPREVQAVTVCLSKRGTLSLLQAAVALCHGCHSSLQNNIPGYDVTAT